MSSDGRQCISAPQGCENLCPLWERKKGPGTLKKVKYILETKKNLLKFLFSIQNCFPRAGFFFFFFANPRSAHSGLSRSTHWSRSSGNSQVLDQFLPSLKALCRVPGTCVLHTGEITSINIARLTRRTGEVACAFVPSWQPRLMLPY